MALHQPHSVIFWLLQGFVIVGSTDHHCQSVSQSGDCEQCHLGWYGAYCGKMCQNCDPGGCNKVTGVCLQCQAGYHSTNCSLTCPSQCRESYGDSVFCDRTTGNCLEGCKQTWWGDQCEHKCGKQCSDSICFFYDGSCAFGCKDGLTGTHCNKPCSVGCSGGSCNQLWGACHHGCKTGFFGRTCDRKCHDKCLGSDCSTQNDGYKPICTRGCVPGWKPPFCDTPCPPNCLSCTEAWVCTSCKKRFTGSRCEKRLHCSENCLRCQQESGNCTACRQGFEYDGRSQCIPMIHASEVPIPGQDSKGPSVIIPIIVAIVIVALIIVAVFIGICIRRRMFWSGDLLEQADA